MKMQTTPPHISPPPNRYGGVTARFALMLVFMATVPSAVTAQSFRVVPERPEVPLGEKFSVSLHSDDRRFSAARILRVEFKDLDEESWHSAGSWKPVEAGDPGLEKGELWRTELHGFEPGVVNLPKATVSIRVDDRATGRNSVHEEISTTTTITIVGVRAADDESTELRGLRPLHVFPRDWTGIWKTVALLALLAALAFAAWKYRQRLLARAAAPPPPEPLLPPGVWALQEIRRRRELPVCRSGPAKDIYSLASEVLRIYAGRRFDLDVMEMTSWECIRSLRERRIDPEIEKRTGAFLNECDMVKFSKFEPPKDRWTGIWNDAEDIVRLSTPPEELDPELAAKKREQAERERARRKEAETTHV